MKIYDEITGEEIITPNLNLGYIYSGTRFSHHVDDKEIILEKSASKFAPNGLKHLVSGHDVYESCFYYHTYTTDEKAALKRPGIQEQIDANASAIMELALMLAGGK